jgi:hypothetical protein
MPDPSWDISRQERLRQLAELDTCLAGCPTSDLRARRAALLDGLGRTEDAKKAYFAILADDPRHATTLSAYGALLHRTGYRTAARTLFAHAVACHPQCAEARVNLAQVLRQAGAFDAARAEFGAALSVDPLHARAHRGLGDLLAERGDPEGAAHHRRLGHTGHAVHGWTYRGDSPPVRVLMPVSVADGNIATRHFLDDRVFAVTTCATEFCDPADRLPPHDVVFNAIADADLCRPALSAAQAVIARSGAPVINAPSRVLATGRADMAEAMARLPGIAVPRVAALLRAIFLRGEGPAALARHGMGCPVLLRAPGFHAGRHFARVDRDACLAEAAASLPGEQLLAIEYLHACGADGKARKGRVMVIDGRLYPLHWAVSSHWKVHYFSSDMACCPPHQEEEARFLRDMSGFLGRRAVAGLLAVAEHMDLDYGGIDFGVLADGRIAVFEANAAMAIVPPPDEARWSYRRPACDVALLAAQTLLIRRAA